MQGILDIAKNLGAKDNVCIRIIDEVTGRVVREHIGHNAPTNTLLFGMGQYLLGGAVTGAGQLLKDWIPQYISLGTMGLRSQETDAQDLPVGLGDKPHTTDEEELFRDYLIRCPGFGSDGTNPAINGRDYDGLGPAFENRPYPDKTVECELLNSVFPRSPITFRQCIPESDSEIPETIDVVFSALISTGALSKFREDGDNGLFITEVGLWSKPQWTDGHNGLLAGYRIHPSGMTPDDMSDPAKRLQLRESILRVGINQVVQVIWKIQLGSPEALKKAEQED